jgi:hypothetical protein
VTFPLGDTNDSPSWVATSFRRGCVPKPCVSLRSCGAPGSRGRRDTLRVDSDSPRSNAERELGSLDRPRPSSANIDAWPHHAVDFPRFARTRLKGPFRRFLRPRLPAFGARGSRALKDVRGMRNDRGNRKSPNVALSGLGRYEVARFQGVALRWGISTRWAFTRDFCHWLDNYKMTDLNPNPAENLAPGSRLSV